jgi:glycosyltransferase involved in cell wall biosynthesis
VWKILVISPGFHPDVNEMAAAFSTLCSSGKFLVNAVACRDDILRGASSSAARYHSGNLTIHYVDNSHLNVTTVNSILTLERFSPDLIFSSTHRFMPIARSLKGSTRTVSVLHTETLDNPNFPLNRRYYLGLRFLKPLALRWLAHNLIRGCDHVICSDPKMDLRHTQTVDYLPWPAFPPERDGIQKDRKFACYVGSLSRGKGAARLFAMYAHLLDSDPSLRVSIVGPPVDRFTQKELRRFLNQYSPRISWVRSSSRKEAMSLIRRAHFVFIPAASLHWGLICDAWSNRTAVISVGEHFDLKAGVNCLIAETRARLIQQVNSLNDDRLYQQLTDQGFWEYENKHSTDVVAAKLGRFLEGYLRKA